MAFAASRGGTRLSCRLQMDGARLLRLFEQRTERQERARCALFALPPAHLHLQCATPRSRILRDEACWGFARVCRQNGADEGSEEEALSVLHSQLTRAAASNPDGPAAALLRVLFTMGGDDDDEDGQEDGEEEEGRDDDDDDDDSDANPVRGVQHC